MSIWCSWDLIGTDIQTRLVEVDGVPHLVRSGRSPRSVRGVVRSYATGWSNHYPTRSVEQPACVDVASIPDFCTPGHEGSDVDGVVGGWLRLSLFTAEAPKSRRYVSAEVVLDEQAARSLAADLLEWADMPKVHPVKAKGDAP